MRINNRNFGKGNLKKAAVVAAALAMSLSFGTAVFAAETEAVYGYQIGQQKANSRHALFEEAWKLATDAEREAFLEEHGIGGEGPYHDAAHLDAEDLAAAQE